MANATTDVMKQVFSEYSVPKTVMSDRGPQFSSKELKAFSNQYCFNHITSSPKYPQRNGNDRMNGTDSEAVPEEMQGSRA